MTSSMGVPIQPRYTAMALLEVFSPKATHSPLDRLAGASQTMYQPHSPFSSLRIGTSRYLDHGLTAQNGLISWQASPYQHVHVCVCTCRCQTQRNRRLRGSTNRINPIPSPQHGQASSSRGLGFGEAVTLPCSPSPSPFYLSPHLLLGALTHSIAMQDTSHAAPSASSLRDPLAASATSIPSLLLPIFLRHTFHRCCGPP